MESHQKETKGAGQAHAGSHCDRLSGSDGTAAFIMQYALILSDATFMGMFSHHTCTNNVIGACPPLPAVFEVQNARHVLS